MDSIKHFYFIFSTTEVHSVRHELRLKKEHSVKW